MKTDVHSIPCILCTRSLEQRSDKNGKPYFVCDECGTQFFIRGALGKERLVALQRSSKTTIAAALGEDVQMLQDYIETFCIDERIIIDQLRGIDAAIPFAEWSREVCERLKSVLSQLARTEVLAR